MTAYFDRFQIQMTMSEARQMSHPGPCDADVEAHLSLAKFRRQFATIDSEDIAAELAEYGAWSDDELTDAAANRLRILWIAAGNIVEEART